MDKSYNPSKTQFKAWTNCNHEFDVPESSTAKQLKEMDEFLEGLEVNPIGLIAEAFERIFNEPFDDGTECPNENEAEKV